MYEYTGTGINLLEPLVVPVLLMQEFESRLKWNKGFLSKGLMNYFRLMNENLWRDSWSYSLVSDLICFPSSFRLLQHTSQQ